MLQIFEAQILNLMPVIKQQKEEIPKKMMIRKVIMSLYEQYKH